MDILHIHQGAERLESLESIPEPGFVWIDCQRDGGADWPEFVARLGLPPPHERHARDSLNAAHPTFFDSTRDYDMIVFRGLAPESQEERIATHAVAFFLYDRLLLTVQPGDSRSIQGVRERLLERSGRQPTNPAALMHLLLNTMVDRFLALREPMDRQLEFWSGRLLDPRHRRNDKWQGVLRLRAQARRLEILCDEQEDALVSWRDSTRRELDESLYVRYTDLLEHIRRVGKFADALQHEVEGLLQLHFAALSHRTNEIMRVLTVLSAIFLPLTLIAGIYGMNFDYMPELRSRHGYYWTLAGMAALAAGLLGWFRWKKWF